jgi:hypothetical protein
MLFLMKMIGDHGYMDVKVRYFFSSFENPDFKFLSRFLRLGLQSFKKELIFYSDFEIVEKMQKMC